MSGFRCDVDNGFETTVYYVIEEFVAAKKTALFVALSTWFEKDRFGEKHLFCPPSRNLVSAAKNGEGRSDNWQLVTSSYEILERYGKIRFTFIFFFFA